MRIKILSGFLIACSAVAVMSCKDDLTLGVDNQYSNNFEDDGQSVYMNLGVSFSDRTGTRSSTITGDGDDYVTSDDGMEYSTLEEYDVRTAIIVLAKMGTYDYIAHADVTGILTSDRQASLGNTGNGIIDPSDFFSFSTKGRFKYSAIAALYDDNGDLKEDYKNGVNVFVFCNPTGDLLSRFENTDFTEGTNSTDWVNWQGTVEQEPSLPGYTPAVTNSIWAPRSFLMSNAKPAYAELPSQLSNWDSYSQDDPFDLSGKNAAGDPDNSELAGMMWGKQRGTVYVERSVGRLDIKPDYEHLKSVPSNAQWLNEEGKEWRYSILGGLSSSMHDGTTDTESGNNSTNFNFIDVQLRRISLVNMSKNFNFLRRVSDTGLDDQSTLMGVERSNNYVVDTDAEIKQQEEGYNISNATQGFNFALFTDREHSNNPELSKDFAYDRNSWFTDNIVDIMNNGKLDNNTTADPHDRYTVWRYFTENTIPQDVAGGNSRQVVVQSTGVVLKGLILPGEDVDKTFDYREATTLSDEPMEMRGNSIRYIPEEVVNALLASKYHLPKYGTGADEKTYPQWKPAAGSSKYEKDDFLNEDSKKEYSFDYPTLYVFQGSIYAGFNTVVKQAQLYDGVGGLMYNAVNSTLGYWWANLDDLDMDNPESTVSFSRKADDFNPASEDNPGNWLQLNVERYNKIVNGFGDGEAITMVDGVELMENRFTVDLIEASRTFRTLLTTGSDASRFTMYDASYEEEDRGGAGWGYYCYYFWWFKHNDNGIDGRMGPMEFATVRNNVYKLTVEKISSLGHPLNTLNDPDPLNPETPDEDDKIYLDVNLKIVPWVVRHNSAEF